MIMIKNKAVRMFVNTLKVQLTPNTELRLCHLCGESSRKAQLIQCDFCPLLYHLGKIPSTEFRVLTWI